MNEVRYISVILPLKLEWEPCYSVPEETDITIGDRVRIVFANRTYIGVVSGTGITPETAPERIRAIESVENDIDRVLPQEIELWRKVAEYYLATVGEVYKAAYPYGKIDLEEARAASRRKAEERLAKAVARLEERIARLETRIARKRELADKARKEEKRAACLKEADELTCEIEEIRKEIAKGSVSGSASYGIGLQEGQDSGITGVQIQFSPAQKTALKDIHDGFAAEKPVMLHGVTGSGKTEVYMSLAQETVNTGRNVLYLVPEIALSRQLEDRLHEVFGERLMIFHSGETAASRICTAEKVRNTNGYIVLGTRSSLFLPHHDLGLIIVDEEHDSSYKQDSPAPRYNGRDTALMLSQIHRDCRIILGSATPSLEEQYNCMSGRHTLVTLSERFHGSDDSEIEIIDTKAERRKNGMIGSFSRKLISHIGNTISEGGQVLILRSRRAWSPVLQCEQCGEIPKCPHCNVSLSLHNNGILKCHYCGFQGSYTGRCGICGGPLKPLGAGTQKIEEESAALFPDAVIARLDSDTAQKRGYEKKVIKDFCNGDIDILIGTQMISKGFDFGNLSLVAVIAADSLLGMQDFRADERAHQLLEQLRGRCGRRTRRGLFVIQTSRPDHPVYQNIASSRHEFGTNLLMERKDFNFPPYTRIVEITVRDRFEDRAERMSSRLASQIRAARPSADGLLNDTVTGPYAPAVDRIADMHIRTIRVSLKKNRQLSAEKAALKDIVSHFEKSEKYDGHIIINVDPS
ncbi:MAG: primosomal protein N' [Bacteroidales bacterium]|nr:primosomal protein N' [Bacteroidales bacterium]